MVWNLLVAAFMAGTSLAALAANFMHWRLQATPRLGAPMLSPEKPIASLLGVAVAGPFLLVNEAMIAMEEADEGRLVLITAIFFAAIWCLASGILWLEFIWQILQLL